MASATMSHFPSKVFQMKLLEIHVWVQPNSAQDKCQHFAVVQTALYCWCFRRLKWLGYVARMSEDKLLKELLLGELRSQDLECDL